MKKFGVLLLNFYLHSSNIKKLCSLNFFDLIWTFLYQIGLMQWNLGYWTEKLSWKCWWHGTNMSQNSVLLVNFQKTCLCWTHLIRESAHVSCTRLWPWGKNCHFLFFNVFSQQKEVAIHTLLSHIKDLYQSKIVISNHIPTLISTSP